MKDCSAEADFTSSRVMDFSGGAARPPKRRRLEIVVDLTETQSPKPEPKQEYVPEGNTHDESYSSANGSASNGVGIARVGPLECCYGMLSDIPLKLRCQTPPSSKYLPVDFQASNSLYSRSESPNACFEIQCQRASQILVEIQAVPEIETQLYCHSRLESSLGAGKGSAKQKKSWFLNIILFGREELEEQVGAYLTKCKQYLQDPRHCERCVPYRNPHVMEPESGEVVMTDSFDKIYNEVDLEIERLQVGPDLLAQLMEDEDPLPETEGPDIVKTSLFRHQKQALTFMLSREKGWALDSGRDIWSRKKGFLGGASYTNNVNGSSSDKAPPDFQGGLLADDMGLGKTLSMITLIATNTASNPSSGLSGPSQDTSTMKATLLVVPPALIQVWEKQFHLHTAFGMLKLHTYHGHNKRELEFLSHFDVIITTYHTVSAIWRRRSQNGSEDNSIFTLRWHRVVLDEAHTIQNPRSQLSQACFALRSRRRWAITGTPIQNKLADFASIVKFLQVHPYSDSETFEEEIIRPWQGRHGTDAQGFLRLKTLVKAITISRTKAVVDLPTRIDEIHHLNFTPAEREKYNATKAQSRTLLEEAISSNKQGTKTFNALWLLNNLRLICNHGLLAQSAAEKRSDRRSQGPPGGISNTNFESLFAGGAICSICESDLFEDFLEGAPVANINRQDREDSHGPAICEGCKSQQKFDGPAQMLLNGDESFDSSKSSGPSSPAADEDMTTKIEFMSTKIKALVADLMKHVSDEKGVVFSYWTNTLDLVQLMLNEHGIPYTRIDGNTSLRRRKEAMRDFQHDISIRVILVSITCGGAGLDLTAGSRVYLLEPHWNPMIEEQALCRVHRVGQKKNVTTIRFLMRDSFEEQIVDIQKRKKMLADVTFSRGPLSESGGIGVGTLQYLRQVLE